MRAVIDTNVLVQLMSEADLAGLKNPETGDMVEHGAARATALVERIDQCNGVVVIPTPVLAEYLIGVSKDAYQTQMDLIGSFSCIEIVPFDQLAAIECALLVDEKEHKQLDPTATKAKLRVDRQIIAIAIANGADELWTHDGGLMAKAKVSGIVTQSLGDIDPVPGQFSFDLPSEPDESGD